MTSFSAHKRQVMYKEAQMEFSAGIWLGIKIFLGLAVIVFAGFILYV